ncbi:MAG TPA: acyloxyacyl hydrolase [Flavobacteriales bacterium]
MRFLLTGLLMWWMSGIQAQEPWSFGLNAHHGFLWPHRTTTWVLVERHAPAIELFAERSVKGDRSWHHDFLMPRYGFGLLYTGMGNAQRIGTCVRVVPYLYLPFTRNARSSFGMRLGWGIGYVAKPFDRRENIKQIAIGSHLNTAIQIMPEYRSERGAWTLQGGIGIDHWSNGSFQLPNLGLNYLSLHLGAGYRMGAQAAPIAVTDTVYVPREREQVVVAAFGVNESVRPLSGQYSVYALSGQVQWPISRKSGLAAGFDVFNKGSLVTANPELKDTDRIGNTQLGVHGGYALLFGRAEMFIQMGAYVMTPVKDHAPVFHRLGGRMRCGKHFVASIALKSHYAVADHWEFGVGYRWN